ncbi:MAG TPA: tetratricopeptide repeat protein [Steroidobacteraceae bacterium]|nr:tetratricopeptide repeat protein [Steroidobacteraceae bacterium]
MTLPTGPALEAAAKAYAARDWPEAEKLCRAVLQAQSDCYEALNLLGIIKAQTGQPEEAAELLERALARRPGDAAAHSNYGNVLCDLGRWKEALALYERALQLDSRYLEAYNNRGRALSALGEFASALASYDQLIRQQPDNADAHYNRAATLEKLNRSEEALESYTRAVRLRPGFADAFYNRGIALHRLQRFEEAVRDYDRALEIAPRFAEAANNRGVSLQELGRYEEALTSYARALSDKPDLADAYNNQGHALSDLRRPQEALQCYQRALQIDPRLNWLYGAWFHTKLRLCDWSDLEAAFARITSELGARRKATQPFTVLAFSDRLSLQRRAGEIFAAESERLERPLPPPARRKRTEVIHIGYYSADFYSHATTQLMAGLIGRHDRRRFLVSAFAFGRHAPDEVTHRLERSFDRFLEVRRRSDREVAQLSRELAIDIAIDLKGFTQDSRPGIFAHRAAPLQVSYLGYPATMGAGYIDYLIADRTVIPAEARREYREKVVYLPHSYQVNDRERPEVEARYSRAQLGLPQTGFVFCCLNSCYKINPATFAGWMRILKAVPGSVLWLLTGSPVVAGNLCAAAERHGVSRERLVFAPDLPVPEHLPRYRAADLFLDTFPCGAHTTASDALWCGLPVATRLGESFASRVAASLLQALGLPELITPSQEAYEALAISLATDVGRLGELRERLKQGRLTSPLFDTALSTRYLETAYGQIYERHQEGLPPEDLEVAAS